MSKAETFDSANESKVAIIGMAGRFPKAATIEELWPKLRDGLELTTFFTDEELIEAGVDPMRLNDPHYVKARATLDGVELFDAGFFGFNPREAELTDPQHRIFLEGAWEALENAGYNPEICRERIGVFAGESRGNYLLLHLSTNPELVESVGMFQTMLGNEKDFLPTMVSYKLNLKGPSVNVQTACSTSLVAVHMACQSLLNGECQMALAGAVSISLPQREGYMYQEGGIVSPDGRCRAFDARGEGTLSGSGMGIVVLKRLQDALDDGDTIHAVIAGSAINNDGSLKIGFTAPSVEGQAEVIAEAMAVAGVAAEDISYVEAHGTATPLGDPIEVEALTQVFREQTDKKNFCALGSVKTNMGHLDTAAGIAGLIKTVLALKHQVIPPSLHFEQPNPKIDFAGSPFFVNDELREWRADDAPRRAGVSSFGMGGTNAHVVLEESPQTNEPSPSRAWQLLTVSARTALALDAATANLAEYLRRNPDANLADVAYTQMVGRRRFGQRRMLVCRSVAEAVTELEALNPKRVLTHNDEAGEPQVTFMFSGQGTQYVNMGRELYEGETVFREQVDLCSELLLPLLGFDLRAVLYPDADKFAEADATLRQTSVTQPALFVVEYALAQLWMRWGVRPVALIGHSLGEYVAACVAGVFSLEDALKLVAARGRLMQGVPEGAMLAVPLPEELIKPHLGTRLSLAAVNAPSLCVVSGQACDIQEMQRRLAEQDIECQLLHTSHAFHSAMMELILEAFIAEVKTVELHAPRVPYISNLTGTWIKAEQATQPLYWASHLRETVRFSEGVQRLAHDPSQILLEIGPGHTLANLARQCVAQSTAGSLVLSSLRHVRETQSDVAVLLQTLGRLWLGGVEIDAEQVFVDESRRRTPLPTYPFERERFWVERRKPSGEETKKARGKKEIADWFYVPSWKRSPLAPAARPADEAAAADWLVFADAHGLASRMIELLKQEGRTPVTVIAGEQFSRTSDDSYTINPLRADDYLKLFRELKAAHKLPRTLVHLWGVTAAEGEPISGAPFAEAQCEGFYSLLFLARALEEELPLEHSRVVVISDQVHEVTGDETLRPEKAPLLAACRIIPLEYPHLTCHSIDLGALPSDTRRAEKLVERLLTECAAQTSDRVIAYRGAHRWVQHFEPIRLETPTERTTRLRQRGIYLILGGLEQAGAVVAEYLAGNFRARLVLVGPRQLPQRQAWEEWLSTHGEDEEISRHIRLVQQLGAQGAEVLTAAADLTDEAQMRRIVEQTCAYFGGLHGVIHTAHTSEPNFRLVRDLNPSLYAPEFEATAHGLLVLEKVLHGRELDFCLLGPSLSAVAGTAGGAASAATDLFASAFARKQNQAGAARWMTVAWEGLHASADVTAATSAAARSSPTKHEAGEALQRALSVEEVTQVIISPTELRTQRDGAALTSMPSANGGAPPNGVALHDRPAVRAAHVAPSNETEQALADIWQAMLGIREVGIHDNFFELGGHSLLATQVIMRMRQTFDLEIPVRSIFENPTIAELALVVENCFIEKIEALSEEEAQLLLGADATLTIP